MTLRNEVAKCRNLCVLYKIPKEVLRTVLKTTKEKVDE